MERSPDDYTVKEMINLFVIPALNDLKSTAKSEAVIQDERITKLESWKNKGIGVVAVIMGILIPVSIPVIANVITGFVHG